RDLDVFYNVTTKKFEIYVDSVPSLGNIIVTLNGAVLANNIDYYQSKSDSKRIILEGDLIVGDILSVVYNGTTTYVGAVNSNVINVYWVIDKAPQTTNGKFVLELSPNKDFDTITTSVDIPYVVNNRVYSGQLTLTGSLGDK